MKWFNTYVVQEYSWLFGFKSVQIWYQYLYLSRDVIASKKWNFADFFGLTPLPLSLLIIYLVNISTRLKFPPLGIFDTELMFT